MLDVKNLAVSFDTAGGELQAVRDVSLSVRAGQVVGVVGESGSGKSVTALSLMRLLPGNGAVTAGSIDFDGVDVLAMEYEELRAYRGNRAAMVFQEPGGAFDPIYPIGRSLSETLRAHNPALSDEEVKRRSIELLEEVHVPNPERRLENFPHQFSGGLLQRIGIAHALANDPELLIADEPTTALDVTIQKGVLELFAELRASRNLAIVFITHDLSLLAGFADRLVVMYGGLVMEEGDCAQVLTAPRHPYTAGLLGSLVPFGSHHSEHALTILPGTPPNPIRPEPGCPFAPRCPLAKKACREGVPAVREEESNSVRCLIPGVKSPASGDRSVTAGARGANEGPATRDRHESSAPLIEFTDAEKHYPLQAGFFSKEDAKVFAVNGVSLSIERGEIYGLVGESGCGKTTTARLLVRMERLTAGSIRYRGREGEEYELASLGVDELRKLRTRIRYIFQDPARSLNPRLTVREVLLSGYRYSPVWPGKQRAEDDARRMLEEVGLQAGDLDRRPAEFSGGQRQRISIARALITRPEVLICDEVVSALDVSIQGQILNLLLRLRQEHNLTMIFIAHDLAVVGYVSDRIGVMYRGVLVEEAPAHQLLSERRHPYTQYLFDSLPTLDPTRSIATKHATPHLFARRGDATANPVVDRALLTMEEPVRGHRVSPMFRDTAPPA